MARSESNKALGLVVGVKRGVATHLATTGHTGVETFVDLVARHADRHVVVGDVEDLVAEAIGSQAAVDHVSQITSIDVGKDVAAPKARVGEKRWEVDFVLVRLDHVVDPQPVDVDTGAGLERSRRRLVDDFRHRVAVVRNSWVVLIDRDVFGPNLAVSEADPVRGLGAREYHLADPQLHRRVDDVVRAKRVDSEGLVVGPNQDRRDRREVDDSVVPRDTSAGFQLVEARIPGKSVEHLTGVGQIDAKVGDALVSERHQVSVDHPVSLLNEMADRMPTGFAAATSEEDSHTPDANTAD